MEPRVAARAREPRVRLPRLDRPARALSRGVARIPPRLGRAADADVLHARLSALGQAVAGYARVHSEDDRRERQAGAGRARPVLGVGRDARRPAGDGVPGRPHTRRAADRAAGDRSLSRGPHADPLRRARRCGARRLHAAARLRGRLKQRWNARPQGPLASTAGGPAGSYLRAEGAPAACVRPSPDGSVLPTKWTGCLPATASGVMIQVPPQEARATFPAVFESAMYVNPLPMPPRMQKLAFTGA